MKEIVSHHWNMIKYEKDNFIEFEPKHPPCAWSLQNRRDTTDMAPTASFLIGRLRLFKG